jgi:hypothetical protein
VGRASPEPTPEPGAHRDVAGAGRPPHPFTLYFSSNEQGVSPTDVWIAPADGLSLRQREPVSVAQAIWIAGIDSLLGDDKRGPAVVGAVALTASPDQASRRTINQAPIPSATTT